MNFDNQKLAAMVRAKRDKQGLRATAAEISGVSPATLSRIEQGNVPDLATFLRLCEWLDVTTEEFVIGFDAKDIESKPVWEKAAYHLRADRTLDPETASALIRMIKLAYEAAARGDFNE